MRYVLAAIFIVTTTAVLACPAVSIGEVKLSDVVDELNAGTGGLVCCHDMHDPEASATCMKMYKNDGGHD